MDHGACQTEVSVLNRGGTSGVIQCNLQFPFFFCFPVELYRLLE